MYRLTYFWPLPECQKCEKKLIPIPELNDIYLMRFFACFNCGRTYSLTELYRKGKIKEVDLQRYLKLAVKISITLPSR